VYKRQDQATERVKTHVSDPDRKAKAVDVLDRMAAAEKAWIKASEPQIESLQALIKDRASTPAAFEKVFSETKDQAAAVQAHLLELRFELKSQLTEGEWTAVFPVPATAK
jgi:hypothetical protein